MSQSIGSVFVIIAPSGTGKTSLVNALLQAETNVKLSVSHTTRAPRVGELNGKHYHFVDRETFEGMIQQGDFLEHAEVYGNYYGTSASWIRQQLMAGYDILLEIDWQGFEQVRAIFHEAIGIFIVPPSLQELERRLRTRATDSEESICRRLAEAQSELAKMVNYDYIVVNAHFEQACHELRCIVKAARLRGVIQARRLQDLHFT